jgi:hypothetical protein
LGALMISANRPSGSIQKGHNPPGSSRTVWSTDGNRIEIIIYSTTSAIRAVF